MYDKTIFKTFSLECYIKPMARPKSHLDGSHAHANNNLIRNNTLPAKYFRPRKR